MEKFYNVKFEDNSINHKLTLKQVIEYIKKMENHGEELVYVVRWFPLQKKG